MTKSAIFVLSALLAAPVAPALADDVSGDIDSARAAYGKGDAIRTLTALQAAASQLSDRLTEQFAKMLPPAPPQWSAGDIETQPLDEAGGGLTVTRGYQNGDAALNASLIVDNPAVATALALLKAGGAPNGQSDWQAVKINGETWLLRFNKDMREGEVMTVLNSRALLQIDATEVSDSNLLTDAAKGWNLVGVRRLLGS